MNKSAYIVILLLLLMACDIKTEKAEFANLAEINLTFSDYNPKTHKSFIDLSIENLILPIERQLKISDNGTVNYSFINSHTKELVFDYEGRRFSLVVSPNERINADLKISDLLNSSKFRDFKITGTNEATNRLILANTFYIDSLILQSTNAFDRDSTLNDIGYKIRRVAEMEAQLKMFAKFISENEIRDETFIDWGPGTNPVQIRNGLEHSSICWKN